MSPCGYESGRFVRSKVLIGRDMEVKIFSFAIEGKQAKGDVIRR
jgi:hypothetical protein